MLRSECGAAAERKRKTYDVRNGDQWTEGPVEERSGSKTRKVKEEDVSIIGTGFRQEDKKSGMNVDGSGCQSGEARKSSMEK